MDKEISIGNTTFTLTRFRSFLFNNEKYTIFVDAHNKDDYGIPAIYIFLNIDGIYIIPPKDILALLNPVCIDILYNNTPFDNKNYPKIKILPWKE